MNGFLSKPIDERALFDELQKVIAGLRGKGMQLPTLCPQTQSGTSEPARTPPPSSTATLNELDAVFGLHQAEELPVVATQQAPVVAASKPKQKQGLSPMPLMSRMTSVFLEEAPRRMKSAQDALRAGDASAVALEMHTLKSSVGYFKLATLQGEFDRLEQMAEAGDLASIESDMVRLNTMLSTCIETLSNSADGSDSNT
jgi:HPt (histidine-containing phosphotransfer) domain-containing protein